MKKFIKNLILLFLISSNAALCYTLTNTEIKNQVLTAVTKETRENLKNFSSDFKINVSGIPTENIVSNCNLQPKIEIISQNNGFSPNSYKRVLIKEGNNILKAFPINVQTLVYKDVLVASNAIPYNQEISSNNTKLEKREVSKYIGKTLSQNINGYVTKRNYQKGSIILSDYIKTKASVLKDSTVDIVFLSSKGLKIKLQGKALKEGSIGDTILVRSNQYNKIYNAVITSSNEVTVRI